MMGRARTWDVASNDSTARGSKRPPCPSLFDIEDDRDLKRARPDDDFAVKARAESKDPRRRPLLDREAVETPHSAPAFSELSFLPGNCRGRSLPTPRSEVSPGRKAELREQEFPLSPRSKSPDVPESTGMTERENPRREYYL